MSISSRTFFVSDNDDLQKVSRKRMTDFYDRKPGCQFLEYAHQIKRTVSVYLLLENRIPKEIIRYEYNNLFFDAEGFIDEKIMFEHMRSGSEYLMEEIGFGELGNVDNPSNVIHKAGYFANEKAKKEALWKPTEDLERKVIRAVLPMGPRE